jgi:hypothetical protein
MLSNVLPGARPYQANRQPPQGETIDTIALQYEAHTKVRRNLLTVLYSAVLRSLVLGVKLAIRKDKTASRRADPAHS